MPSTVIGRYEVVEASRATPEDKFWLVYQTGVLEPISQHPTKLDAIAAAKRYLAADKRRAA